MQKLSRSFLFSLSALLCKCLAIDNGLGITPPMGWRSWNCYSFNISDSKIRTVVQAIVSRERLVGGKATSLADLGYSHVGIDDGWQDCGKGVGGSFHDKAGNPIVNGKFPDMEALVDYGHSQGVMMGWYANNCQCRETDFPEPKLVYEGDVKLLASSGFDGIKLDNCGEFTNLTLWSDLINKTGKAQLIENCHWGLTLPEFDQETGDLWCPFNLYRTSADVYAEWPSVLHNLFSTTPFQDEERPLSRPGCWAYPDMLETGNFRDINMDRTHFGAWAIVSSPLILGFDVTDVATVDRVWPIISNKEAIAINQAWAGSPGSFVKSWTPPSIDVKYVVPGVCNSSDISQSQWVYDDIKHEVRWTGSHGNTSMCWDAQDGGGVMLLPCDGSRGQSFTYHSNPSGDYGLTFSNYNGNCVMVGEMDNRAGAVKPGPGLKALDIGGCNAGDTTIEWIIDKAHNTLHVNNTLCLGVQDETPDPKLSPVMLWKKVLPGSRTAILVINNFYKGALDKVEVDLSWLRREELVHGAVTVRDVWNHKDVGTVTNGTLVLGGPLQPFDSGFFVLAPLDVRV